MTRKTALLIALSALVIATLACGAFGQPEPALEQLETVQAYQATQIGMLQSMVEAQETQIAHHAEIISYLATQVMGVHAPHPSGTVTPTPYTPVSGGLTIAGGSCCVGGEAGETVEIDVVFEASSPGAEVVEMKVIVGGMPPDQDDIANAEWEPFVESKTYPWYVAINWTSFYVSVVYRDTEGNYSPVYTGDVAVEGHPPAPTP